MQELELAPYALPPNVLRALIDIARKSDMLIFGELHGTQEVPRLVLTLLGDLATAGYDGLALEIPRQNRDALEHWARMQDNTLPEFFAQPLADGRGNREVLALIQRAVASQNAWSLLCFDQGPDQLAHRWVDRDGWMAHNLTEQWHLLCPGAKIVGICGNLHSRIALPSEPDATQAHWPSFARQLQDLHPAKTVCTIHVRFQAGTYFNMKRHHFRRFSWRWLCQRSRAVLRGSRDHSFELLLPRATAAMFLAPPRVWSTSSARELEP